MARSHHRKKHKSHLKQFKQHQDISSATASGRSSGAIVFTIAGAITGLALSYFATTGLNYWMIVGTIAGAILGFLMGKRLDKSQG